ncbi:hypothetical protein SAMN05660860_01657 [Geoalkalibacter ferrihydriticus]|uniref:Toxin VasX N-terminal region domain-containing protein n=2 Tax=Geoalkalibacter ferrihydriticus TaxID=392333 RepID=A0A0C2ED63_9BACT|nr:toxin VasX [Geoalkalibacter ferrihydriticus]KIH76538.1 hypothetical protein GFER_10200 [Geoalkalibacter ferrihydriticus DSM 17813]SDM00380.1 hypothetical protein SAMN05660860_01657 [Geoalkalibacter ferrihydriticus]
MSRQHRRLARYIDGEGDAAQRYRELVIDDLNPGTQKLSLVMRDLAFSNYSPEDREFIVLPLASAAPTVPTDAPRPSCIEEYPNFVIPIIPKRYATPEPDQTRAQELRKGWLYVYRNGYLWRELEVLAHGHTRDVNLRRHQGKDERPASGETDSRVIIPYKMAGRHQQIEIAYSEVQWSWARINALGGMDTDPKEEPRLRPDTSRPQISKEEAAAMRRARMQDFTAELRRFIAGEDTENIQSVENCTEEIYSLHLHRFSKLPVVYVHDPIGVAKDLATEVFIRRNEYLQGRNQAAEEAGSKHAMAEIVFQMGLGSKKAADLVDMDELRYLLKWDRQIAHLHALEEAAVALGEYITRAPVAGCPDVHVSMQDYDEHTSVENLLRGQLLSSELVGHLIYGEGQQYLGKSLNQPDHFLVGALNPPQRKIEILGKNTNTVAEFFENLAAGAQSDPALEKAVFELFARIIEQISDGEYTLAQGNFDLAPLLAGSAAAGAKGGYLSSSFTVLARGRFDVAQWVVVKKGLSSQMALTLGRSMEWLQANQPLIKLNAVRLFAVLEVMNLGKAVAGIEKGKFGIAEARFAAASATIISLGFTYLKDVKQIGAGWDNKALPLWEQQLLTKKRIFVAGGAHGFGFVGNVIIVALAWSDVWAAYKKENTGGAVAATVAALGSTILAAATTLGGLVEMNTLRTPGFTGAQAARAAAYGKARVPLTRYFQISRVGAGTFIGIAVLVVGGALMYYFSRTPLEHFLARGPFGKDKDKRYHGATEFQSWSDDAIAEARLFNLLFSPTLDPSLERSSNGYRVDLRIHLPLLFEGKTRIDYRLYGLPPMGFHKPAEKRVIPPSSQGQLVTNPDGSHTLRLSYDSEAIKGFVTYEAQALVDLYGDGSQVLPVNIEKASLAGHAPVVMEFPEALQL